MENKKIVYLIATNRERELLKNLPHGIVIRTGVGAYETLSTLMREHDTLKVADAIVNIGYAGGLAERVGTKMRVLSTENWGHEDNPDIVQVTSFLNYDGCSIGTEYENIRVADGYTCDLFKSNIEEDVVYDMELWYIYQYLDEHNMEDKLESYKVISDNGNIEQYLETSVGNYG